MKGKQWLTIAFLTIWVMFSLAVNRLLVTPRQHLFDFYPRWVGARAVLSGENPYSPQVSQRIQEGMFGQQLDADQDQHRFAYNAAIAWLLLPFWLLPFPFAVSLWISLQFLLLLIAPIIMMSQLKWKPPLFAFIVLLIFSVLIFRHSMVALVLGQFIPFALVGLVIAAWGITKRNWIVTTVSLTSLLVRPEIVIVPLFFLLFTAWQEGMRRAVVVWAGSAGVLWLLTRLQIGSWEIDFLRGIRDYSEYASIQWPPLAFSNKWLAALIASGVSIWGIWMWRQTRFLPSNLRLAWGMSTAILLTLILFPQTSSYTLTLSLLSAWVILWAAQNRWLEWGLTLIVLASPWFFHAMRIPRLDQLLIPLAYVALSTYQYLKKRNARNLDGSSVIYNVSSSLG